MNRPVKIILIGQAKEAYEKINSIVGKQKLQGVSSSEEMTLLSSIHQKISLLKDNPFYGDNIQKRLIPKNYVVTNLWRVELAGYWRMLYTIKGDQIEIVCFVLDIIDHKQYDKTFGYKKR